MLLYHVDEDNHFLVVQIGRWKYDFALAWYRLFKKLKVAGFATESGENPIIASQETPF